MTLLTTESLLEQAQGLVNQMRQELQPSEGRCRVLDEEIKSFSYLVIVLFVGKVDCTISKLF